MFNIIKSDIFRITKNIAFYIAVGIILLMIGASVYMVSPGAVGQASVGDVSTTEFSDETLFEDLTYEEMSELSVKDIRKMTLEFSDYKLDEEILKMNMNLYYCFIFIAAIVITVDFSSGSVKNTLSSAISRKKYFISKTAFVIGICLLMFFMNTYVCYFANLIFNKGQVSSDLWSVTRISLLQLPPMISLISILTGIAFTVKKTSIYNIIAIPLVMVFQLVLGLVMNICNVSSEISSKIFSYELQIMIGKLASGPSVKYITSSYIICGIIIAVFLSLGYFSFRKTEIK